MMSVLISPKELHEQLDKVVVLDARGFAAYEAAHIPGSFAIGGTRRSPSIARYVSISTTIERVRGHYGFSHSSI